MFEYAHHSPYPISQAIISFPKCLRKIDVRINIGSQWKDRMDQLIYKPCTTELCIKAISEDLVEPALVVVVLMLVRIICASNVHYNITCREDTGPSRPDKARKSSPGVSKPVSVNGSSPHQSPRY